MRKSSKFIVIGVVLTFLLTLSFSTTQAGDLVLSNNSGNGNAPWRILGEASMVINGYDLVAEGITRPATIDRISISIAATPGTTATAVVYGDDNGGSPVDATLLRQEAVAITTTGVFTYTFSTPVTVNQPVVWVGFYLPVDYEFFSDTSGSSVLTYWAWEPGATFDVTSLANASVVGPSDGTAPVNLDIGGVARINVEFDTDGNPDTNADTTTTTTTANTTAVSGDTGGDDDIIRQVVAEGSGNITPPLASYAGCETLYVDVDDIVITYRSGIRFFCQLIQEQYAPATPDGYIRRGVLFDVYAFNGPPSGINTRLQTPVTHCVSPQANDLTTAVVGLAYGTPREFEILPSVRFGTLVCAETAYTGTISYFVPSN